MEDLPCKVYISPLGSGSHFPFSMHVDVSDPLSISPGGQLNIMEVPSTEIRSLNPTTFGRESLLTVDNNSGSPQLAIGI